MTICFFENFEFYGDPDDERQPPSTSSKVAALLAVSAADRATGNLEGAREALDRIREIRDKYRINTLP